MLIFAFGFQLRNSDGRFGVKVDRINFELVVANLEIYELSQARQGAALDFPHWIIDEQELLEIAQITEQPRVEFLELIVTQVQAFQVDQVGEERRSKRAQLIP